MIFSILFYVIFIVVYVCFLFCVFCVFCFVLCVVFFFCIWTPFTIYVQVYRPLPAGGNPTAVKKNHIIYRSYCDKYLTISWFKAAADFIPEITPWIIVDLRSNKWEATSH